MRQTPKSAFFRTAATTSILAGSLMLSGGAHAFADKKKDDNAPPPIFQAVIDCKNLTDAETRLACYDQKVAALEQAQADRQVVVADRKQIKKARRGLFGFSLPKIKLFSGGDDDDEEEIKELNTTVKAARTNYKGFWTITVEDGAVWQQTENSRYTRTIRPGDKIRIKQAALGSYKANVNGGLALRVRRVR